MKKCNKSVIPVILIFTFLIGITSLLIFFEYNAKLSKYGEYIEYCNIQRDGFELYMKCEGFLTGMVQTQEPYSCYNFILVKDKTSIKETKICELDIVINDDDPNLYTELKVPIYLIFKYTRDSLLSYKFESMEIKHIDREDAIKMVEELKENGIEITGVKIVD